MRDIFETLLARADIGVAVLAPDETIERFSSALAVSLGRSPESLMGLPLFELMPATDRVQARSVMKRIVQGPTDTVRAILRLIRPDGSVLVTKAVFTAITREPEARVVVLLDDISAEVEAIDRERKQERTILRAYSDLVSSITAGRLCIVSDVEFVDQLGEIVCGPIPFSDEMGPSLVRHEARQAIAEIDGVEWDPGFELGFGELLVNALTHAGGGEASVHVCGDVLQAVVRDNGNGVDFTTITNVAIDTPEDAPPSLGVGFTLMLSFADRMLVSTGSHGTAMALERQTRRLGGS